MHWVTHTATNHLRCPCFRNEDAFLSCSLDLCAFNKKGMRQRHVQVHQECMDPPAVVFTSFSGPVMAHVCAFESLPPSADRSHLLALLDQWFTQHFSDPTYLAIATRCFSPEHTQQGQESGGGSQSQSCIRFKKALILTRLWNSSHDTCDRFWALKQSLNAVDGIVLLL